MKSDHSDSSPLMAPLPMQDPSVIDLEAGPDQQIQCRICLETDGRDFIAPSKCKGTSKFVLRECLDHWRSVKEGFAFAHCTTCKAPYYIRVQGVADRKWHTLKFRFFVTRYILFIFFSVQQVIALLGYLVYFVDGYQKFWLCLTWGYDGEISFYYICEECAVILLSHVGNCAFVAAILGYVLIVICPALYVCGLTAPHASKVVQVLLVKCGSCLGGAGEAGLPLLLIVAIIVVGLFTVIGISIACWLPQWLGRGFGSDTTTLAKIMLTKVTLISTVMHAATLGLEDLAEENGYSYEF